MKRFLLLYFLFLSHCIVVWGQSVHCEFPIHSGESLLLALNNGVRSDTIVKTSLDKDGKAFIAIPAPYTEYKGMATLKIGNNIQFVFIVAGEDMSISCHEEYPNGNNIVFSNSPENDALLKWFEEEQVRKQQIYLLSELVQLYDKSESFANILQKEQLELEKSQKEFYTMLETNSLYAAKFLILYNFMTNDVESLAVSDSQTKAKIRQTIIENLDLDNLYSSGLWFQVIKGILELYTKESPFRSDFIKDMSYPMRQTLSDVVYTTFADNLFSICEEYGWVSEEEEDLASLLVKDKRIEHPEGNLKLLLTLFKVTKGSEIPDLKSGALPNGKKLLVFYESGCDGCNMLMTDLVNNYLKIKEHGLDIISISADVDKNLFDLDVKRFPWKDKRCDLKGFESSDFLYFGVIGTPVVFLINENNVLEGRYYKMEQLSLN